MRSYPPLFTIFLSLSLYTNLILISDESFRQESAHGLIGIELSVSPPKKMVGLE